MVPVFAGKVGPDGVQASVAVFAVTVLDRDVHVTLGVDGRCGRLDVAVGDVRLTPADVVAAEDVAVGIEAD